VLFGFSKYRVGRPHWFRFFLNIAISMSVGLSANRPTSIPGSRASLGNVGYALKREDDLIRDGDTQQKEISWTLNWASRWENGLQCSLYGPRSPKRSFNLT